MMSKQRPMDLAEACRRAESLVSVVADAAAAGEADRRVPQHVMDAIASEELFELVVPTSLGGHGLGLEALGEVTKTLGRACPATAWTTSFLMLHAWLLSKMPEQGREELFAGTAAPLAPAPLAPTGVAVPTKGGFIVDGRWEWATGVAHADWLLAHAIIDGPEFATRFVVIPISKVTIEDVWFTSGMRATRSNTVSVTGCFVPEHRTISASEFMNSSTAVAGDGLAGIPVVSVLALAAAAPALGGAEGVAAHYHERLSERVLAYTLGDKASHQPAAQIRLATVDDLLATADARWRNAIRGLNETDVIDLDQRVDTRLAAASTVRMARQAIGMACEGAGASVYFDSHPMQRIQRDVETLKGHVIFDWDRTTELAGKHRLGHELGPTDMV